MAHIWQYFNGPYVAVPGRNQILFCCTFQSHYHLRSTVPRYFHYGWGSYVLCELMNTIHVYTVHMSLCYSTSNVVMRLKYAMEYCSIPTRDCHKNDLSNNKHAFHFLQCGLLRSHPLMRYNNIWVTSASLPIPGFRSVSLWRWSLIGSPKQFHWTANNSITSNVYSSSQALYFIQETLTTN